MRQLSKIELVDEIHESDRALDRIEKILAETDSELLAELQEGRAATMRSSRTNKMKAHPLETLETETTLRADILKTIAAAMRQPVPPSVPATEILDHAAIALEYRHMLRGQHYKIGEAA